jgi:hypothetical protein
MKSNPEPLSLKSQQTQHFDIKMRLFCVFVGGKSNIKSGKKITKKSQFPLLSFISRILFKTG